MARKLVSALDALGVIVVVFAAVPVVLVLAGGWPIPTRWTAHVLAAPRTLLDVAVVVCWVSWAAYCTGLVRDVAGRVRRHDAAAGQDPSLRDRLAARLAGAILALAPMAVLAGTVSATASPAPAGVTASAPAGSTAAAAPAVAPPPAPAPVPAEATTYTVVGGDCLSMIAARLYGSEADWTSIAQVNLGHTMDDGRVFTDPNLIMPGWVLTLPSPTTGTDPPPVAPATAPAAGVAPTGPTPTASDNGPGAAPAAPAEGPGPAPSPQSPTVHQSVGGASTAPAHPATPGSPAGPTATVVPLAGSAGGHPASEAKPSDPAPRSPIFPAAVPEAAALGVSALVAAALARRVRRSRRLARAVRAPGEVIPDMSRAAAGISVLLEPLAAVPALDWLELANRHLTAAAAAADRTGDVPRIRLVRVGPAGVELLLAAAQDWAPDGFETTDNGHTWLLPTSSDPDALSVEARRYPAWAPALIPIGDDMSGTYLIPLEPGRSLPVGGVGADQALAAMARAAASWPWAEQVTVTDDPELAASAALAVTEPSVTGERPRVVYTGDPEALDAETRGLVGVLGSTVDVDDLAVAVAGGRAAIEPLSVLVDVCRFTQDTAAAVDELLEQAATEPAMPESPAAPPPAVLVPAGPVEVKLLTPTPTIVGLESSAPSNVARRVTELVAYLALAGRPVDGDLLRSRVLGPAGTEVSPTTLQNIVSEARSRLGRDADGRPRLPKAAGSGLYRLSAEVTTDVDRLLSMAAAAAAAEDPVTAGQLAQAALDLIDGEPLTCAGGRYNWWAAEQSGRVATAAADAAGRIAALAEAGVVSAGDARAAVAKARLVAPWDEALDQAEMRVEKAAGNNAGVHLAYRRTLARAEELTPGGLPSEQTEAVYANLVDRPDVMATAKTAASS